MNMKDKTHASHPEDMRQVPFSNYMENPLQPITCSKNSDCGSYLVCGLHLSVAEVSVDG